MPIPPEPALTPDLPPPAATHHKVLIGAVVCILLILSGIGIALFLSRNTQNTALTSSNEAGSVNSNTPQATPFPFEDMTVPYLRQQDYQSSLAELSKVSDNGSYSSYLTSYQSEGFKVNGLLTIPNGEQPADGWPAIVFIHGYIPPNQYQTQARYIDHVASLARSGFVVFKIDLRGHGNSEGEPGGGYFSGDYVTDTLNAHAALAASDFVNGEKIGLWGHSMAGNVALRVMAAKPGIPAAAIWAGAVYTYTDMREYGIQDSSYQPQPSDSERQRKRQQMRELYGDPTADHWFWKLVAPTNYLSDLKGAIQLNHAANDDVVSIEYSRNLARLLETSQVPYEMHEYTDGGHNITGASFNIAMQNTISFFNKHLK